MLTSFRVSSVSRILIALALLWLLVQLIISGLLHRLSVTNRDKANSSVDNRETILAQLSRATNELTTLKTQNEELKNLIENILPIYVNNNNKNNNKNKNINDNTNSINNNSYLPSQEYELTRRRISDNINELCNYLRTNTNSSIMQFVNHVKYNLLYDLGIIENRDNKWRSDQLKQLSHYVQSKIKKLQNPSKELCRTAKKLVCRLNKRCGFGCQMHHLIYCMIVSMATNRTLILNSNKWSYSRSKNNSKQSQGWNAVFMPMSDTCVDESGTNRSSWSATTNIDTIQVIDLPAINLLKPRPDYLPQAIPQQISKSLITLHGDPFVWFIGQIVHYVMRPSPDMMRFINKQKSNFNFKRPCVGIHVRRTDKILSEAAFHPLSEYMTFVDHYYNRLELVNERNRNSEKIERLVYLSTDDSSVWTEDIKPYKNSGYNFIGDSQTALTASVVGNRYSIDSLQNIILDVWLLSECDFIVCTFSSNVCRLAYELMQANIINSSFAKYDRSRDFYSLDDIYYFDGQSAHIRVAILNHNKSANECEIDFKIGDTIHIAGNHWNGYSKGLNRVSNQNGLYPGFKTVEKIETAHFKIFERND